VKRYAEIHKGFVVGYHERDDHRVPEFAGSIAVKVEDEEDDDFPDVPSSIGDEYLNGQFIAPTRPNPNLEPPPLTDREVLDETRAAVDRIIEMLKRPGPP